MKLPLAFSALLLSSFPGPAANVLHAKAISIAGCAPLGAAIPALPAYGPVGTGSSKRWARSTG